MNLLCFPSCLPLEAVKAILRRLQQGAGGRGGHRRRAQHRDKEPKYGLCVTGFARPEEILTNSGAREGDLLVLTNPLGTGIARHRQGGLLGRRRTGP